MGPDTMFQSFLFLRADLPKGPNIKCIFQTFRNEMVNAWGSILCKRHQMSSHQLQGRKMMVVRALQSSFCQIRKISQPKGSQILPPFLLPSFVLPPRLKWLPCFGCCESDFVAVACLLLLAFSGARIALISR